jgi:predicted O-methyltransferase YrrM
MSIVRTLLQKNYDRLISFGVNRQLRRRGFRNVAQIPTFTVVPELEALFLLARKCRPGARVLEVGSYLGASTCYLAAGLSPTGTIVCVDTWQNQTMPDGIRDTLAEFQNNLAPAKDQITQIRKASSDVTPAELGEKFDLIFLDGDHSYQQTKSDFQLAAACLAEDGVIAFHDSLYFEGVSRVIGEALATGAWQCGGLVRNLFWIRPAKFAHRS